MRAVDLTGDLTFEGLLKNWEENGRPPEVLVDFLLDAGLEYQAENVRAVVNRGCKIPGSGGEGGIRPIKLASRYYWIFLVHSEKPERSTLIAPRFSNIKRRSTTYREALLALIDCEPQNEVSLSSTTLQGLDK